MSKLFTDGRKDITLEREHQHKSDPFGNLLHHLFLRLNNLSRSIEAFIIKRALRQVSIRHVDQIPTYTSKRELRTLYKLAAASPPKARVLEIGAHLGASSCYLAAGLAQAGGQLFSVDTWQNDAMPDARQDTMAAFQKNIYPVRHLITPLRKNSQELTAADFQRQFDLIFIDGDHSYPAVRHDFTLVQSWLAPDGIIAFHDFSHEHHEGVTRIVGEALASGEWVLAGLVDSLAWIKRTQRQRVYSPPTSEDNTI